MTYELTSLLITVAAVSASFVAILGGFIASKLLSLNNEREKLLNTLKHKESEIIEITKFVNKQQGEVDTEYAEDFVVDNIERLFQQEKLDSVYSKTEYYSISYGAMLPYWGKALSLVREFFNSVKESKLNNSDNIPLELAEKYVNNCFEYDVLKEIVNYFDKQISAEKNPLYKIDFRHPRIKGLSFVELENNLVNNKTQLERLLIEKELLLQQKTDLKKPKGITIGLIIFALFAIFSIILPLCFVPFETNDKAIYFFCKTIFLLMFVCGIASVFIYLGYLLSWKNGSKKEKNNE